MGKTTIAVHLCHGLALAGESVALFDLDPQGNATVATESMSHEAGGEADAMGPMIALAENWWLLPSPGAERNLPQDLSLDVDGLEALVAQLKAQGVDWLVVDCPPRMDQWGWAGLRLCGEVLVPVQAEFFAMHGLSRMLETLDEAQAQFPGKARLLGVMATLVDTRETVSREVLQDLQDNLGDRLLDSVLYRDSSFVEAASHGITLLSHDPYSKGARDSVELTREVLHGRPSTRSRT